MRVGGYAVITSPDSVVEMDTIVCAHCNRIVHIKPKMKPDDCGGFCRLCMKAICPACCDLSCVPFERKLEQMESSYHARRSYEG